jgi:hypothetical protein
MRLHPVWLAAALVYTALPASAQEASGTGSFTLPTVTIVGRIQRPVAAIEVNRVRPAPATAQFKQPFAEAIATAVRADPF